MTSDDSEDFLTEDDLEKLLGPNPLLRTMPESFQAIVNQGMLNLVLNHHKTEMFVEINGKMVDIAFALRERAVSINAAFDRFVQKLESANDPHSD